MMNQSSNHPILHRNRIQLLQLDFILLPELRRLINLFIQFRKRNTTLLLRQPMIISIALDHKLPRLGHFLTVRSRRRGLRFRGCLDHIFGDVIGIPGGEDEREDEQRQNSGGD